ncbi:hypothetical protein CACET_c09330 [Clostridium aceticum]|uniref:Uncharacterized protein n=1 Tax=Clostridium aceticum TaxID=84022 RepID=A0A0D8IDJ3_9CLOT|nr:hypothetical protein [Clostridium aceticum]AKL94440.1 hypothetical protein CACET_c09330 [Clostridium aceticum]KJF28338.1 hypothetical protein TZ02_02935 [Clostridium aceticum]
MEKIKDLLHDFSDVFIAVVIASLMVGVVVFNLGDWFDSNSTAIAIDSSPEILQEEKLEISQEIEEEAEEEFEENSAESTEPVEPVEPAVVEDKVFTIPSGTPASGIATILLDNGVIESSNDFIKTAEELDLLLKLKSGTFTIPNNSELKDIVRIIAGER